MQNEKVQKETEPIFFHAIFHEIYKKVIFEIILITKLELKNIFFHFLALRKPVTPQEPLRKPVTS